MKQLWKIRVRFKQTWTLPGIEERRYSFEIRQYWFRMPGSRWSMTRREEYLRGEVIGLIEEVSA